MSSTNCSNCGDKDLLILKLRERILFLDSQIAQNSSNSSKPPSSDGLRKKPSIPGSQRRPSGKKRGGQLGHKGSTLLPRATPDKIIDHSLLTCSCGQDLSSQKPDQIISSQVFDLPPTKLEVTEHRFEVKTCSCCKISSSVPFPSGLKGLSVEYGPHIKAYAVYLMHFHLIPLRRVSLLLKDLYQIEVSIGSLDLWAIEASGRLSDFEKNIATALKNAEVVHFDETGMRCEGSLHWLHSASNLKHTFFGIHSQRGSIAMTDFGILPDFTGLAVHDHWKAYFNFIKCLHVLCNSHILRELTFIHEELHELWAKKMKELLQNIETEIKMTKAEGLLGLSAERIRFYEKKYDQILLEALKFSLLHAPVLKRGKRGKQKQTKSKNLIDRMQKFKIEILRFMHDFRVPFTNNQGERDIRMNKVKQKISGCFRSFNGAQVYCRIRSFFSTAQKQNVNLQEAILAVFLNISLPISFSP